MPLNWDLSDIKNYKNLYRKVTEGEQGYSTEEIRKMLKQSPKQMIYYTMTIGMREITDKNWEQFYNRVKIWELINGVSFYKRNTKKLVPLYTTQEDVKRMIGLKTNASSMNASKFKKQLFASAEHYGLKM
jgi:hypothetical protein